MALNLEFEADQVKSLKTGLILIIVGFVLSVIGGPIGLIVSLVALWRVGTTVTDIYKQQWAILLWVAIGVALVSLVWSGFYLDILFKLFGWNAGGGMPSGGFYDPGLG